MDPARARAVRAAGEPVGPTNVVRPRQDEGYAVHRRSLDLAFRAQPHAAHVRLVRRVHCHAKGGRRGGRRQAHQDHVPKRHEAL